MINKKLNITILCGADPYQGPGVIALDIYKWLNQDGHTVEIISNQVFTSKDSNVKSIGKKDSVLRKILLKVQNIEFFKWIKTSKNIATKKKYFMLSLLNQNKSKSAKQLINILNIKPDVLIYLFSHNFLTPLDLKKISEETKAPILFWLMDSEAMTGGCHFTWDCDGYKSNCAQCPGIKFNNSNDLASQNLLQKKKIFQEIKIHPVYCTETQRKMINSSSVFNSIKSYNVYIPIDEKKYYKSDEWREKNNISKDKFLIFFAAQQLNDERKGMKHLLNSLKVLSEKLNQEQKDNIIFIIAGKNLNFFEDDLGFNYIHIGYVSQFEFSEIMNCASLFINPSIEDAGPMVINQALMSGTPVVAYDIGIAKDFVKNNISGYLAKVGDELDLANGIYSLINMPSKKIKTMSVSCREIAMKHFSSNPILVQFNNIFNDLFK